MKRILFAFGALTLLAASCTPQTTYVHYAPPTLPMRTLLAGNTYLGVEVARSEQQQEQGLSDRALLSDNRGMLFDFSGVLERQPGFWMKDMHFSLDFLWVYQNKVIGITPNVPPPLPNTPDSNLKQYFPPSDVDTVIEVNTGWAAAHHVTTGTKIKTIE